MTGVEFWVVIAVGFAGGTVTTMAAAWALWPRQPVRPRDRAACRGARRDLRLAASAEDVMDPRPHVRTLRPELVDWAREGWE